MSLPKLKNPQLDLLNEPFILQEIKAVIQFSNLFKSPDGLPNEYYRSLVDVVSPHLLSACHSIINNKAPLPEMLQAITTMIPKPGKSTDDPANF